MMLARLRSLFRGLFRRDDLETEMREEFAHHIEMRAADLEREGLSAEEARRKAHLEFGHTEGHREKARASRGLRIFEEIRFSWLDVKLGIRMLWKHPGLTAVALFSLAVGIPVGMAPMHLSRAIEAPLPVPDGDRVWAIRHYDAETTATLGPTAYDLATWRDELTRFEGLAAARHAPYAVEFDDGPPEPLVGAQVTANAFQVLRIPPLMGRTFQVSDEAEGAPDVVLIGHEYWQSRLGGDPAVVGRSLRVGGTLHTIIGVMPEGFAFPIYHDIWVSFREAPDAMPGEGLELWIFGRLADGVTPEEAHRELAAVRTRMSAEFPETYGHLQPEVVPFGFLFMGIPRGGLAAMPEFYLFQFFAFALLLVPCANVAMLIFARTATRGRELAVRTALGAGRLRIVSQIFTESFVLAVLAAGIGLVGVDWMLGRVVADVPYWLDLGITTEAVIWGLALAILSAVVAGIIPALRVTGKKIQENIQRARSATAGTRFGGVTTALIIGDVAIAVTVATLALGLSDMIREVLTDESLVGIPAEEYLAVEVRLPVDETGSSAVGFDEQRFSSRLADVHRTLVERLEEEPGVRSVAVASVLPRMDHSNRLVQVETPDAGSDGTLGYIRAAAVTFDYFDRLDQSVLLGRTFTAADAGDARTTVIVNTKFVDEWLGGAYPIGRRLRFRIAGDDSPTPWHEIVGVVGHLGVNMVTPGGESAIYRPAAPGEIYPIRLAVHVGDSPLALAPRIREIVTEVEPTAFLEAPVPLNTVMQGDFYIMLASTAGFVLLVGVLVVLAASGLYAIMSFAVSERTREIGIRTALGARRGTILVTIVRRAMTQIGIGALLAMPLAARLSLFLRNESDAALSGAEATLLALGVGLGVMAFIALFACTVPTLRALRIEPTEALRAE